MFSRSDDCGMTPDNAIGYAQHFSRSHDVVIRVYDAAGNVIETHEHKGDFQEW
jgi:tryptophan synthase beta subunit